MQRKGQEVGEGSGGKEEKERQGEVRARESLVSLAFKCCGEALKKADKGPGDPDLRSLDFKLRVIGQ